MARRPGLGKGLNALIPENEGQSQKASKSGASGVASIPIDQILPNPRQPRGNMNDVHLEELAASIQSHGILQPLVVSFDEKSDQYTIIAGERRWRAAKIAGLTMVPVIARKVTEQGQLELALIENLQRSDLTPLEMAEAYRQLSEIFSLTHEQIAERVGKSRTSISNTLRLLNLPEKVRIALAESKISEGHARALLGLPTSKAQQAALDTVINLALNVRQTEALVQKLIGEKPKQTPRPLPPPDVTDLENKLRSFLGTKVNLNKKRNGGSLIIHYYSDEELNAILDKILPASKQ